MTQHRFEGASRRRSVARGAGGLTLAAALALTGGLPAIAQADDPGSDLTVGTFQEYVGSNDRMLQYHYFDNGDNGVLLYFDGDETTNFHYPDVAADVVHQPGVGNGHVQRMKEEAAARGMDLIFLEHPHGEDVPLDGPGRTTGTSWWNYMDDSVGGEVDEFAEVVREIIADTQADNVQMVGYSGGAEFLVRHLLLGGNEWLPENSAAAMIGGGGLAGYPLETPAPGKEDMSYAWLVGLEDGPNVEDTSVWSALRTSRNAVADFQALGYTGASIKEIPATDHYNYDFRGLVGERLDLLLADAPDSGLTEGTFQEFTASNGRMLEYHYFENGDNGTLFYFDGDGTTNFHYPEVPADVFHQPGVGNGHVQRMNEEAAARGVDLVFIEHPEGHIDNDSWWTGAPMGEYTPATQELIQATNDENVLFAGYSGGAEFLSLWLIMDGTSWQPDNANAMLIGGGGTYDYPITAPTAASEDMRLVWYVGDDDGVGATDPPTWSAWDAANKGERQYREAGFTNTHFVEIPDTNHVQYDFRALVGTELDHMTGQYAAAAALVDNGDGTFAVEAEGLAPGGAVEATFTQAGTVVTTELGTADVYGAFSDSFSIADGILPGRFTVSVRSGSTTSSTLTSELRTANDDNPGLYQVYTGSNGKELEFHHFDNGDNGTLFYFDGDGTSNFHMPLVPASVSHTGGFNGQVQRLNAEAAERGVDLIFVEHPNSDNTWWENYQDVLLAEDVVKEMVDDLGHDSVLLAGYSGGAEFLVSWMLIDGNDWGPDNTALVMIGGGTLDPIDELVDPAEGRADQRISWVVGENDGVGATWPAEWSALGAATAAQTQFASQGYTGAAIDVVPDTNHLQYDFRGIVGDELDLLLANAPTEGEDDQPGEDGESGQDDEGSAPSAPTPDDDEAEDDSLPRTGAEPLWAGALAALVLAALGGLAVMRTRRS